MKKKILICLIVVICLFIFVGCQNKKEETKTIRDFNYFKNINVDDIEKVEIIKYTEAGDNHKEITDLQEIKNTYSMINNIKIGEETDMACEDNATVYIFSLKNSKKVSIEIECDWIILNGKRYIIK